MDYLTIFSASEAIYRRMAGWLVNDEYEGVRQEAVLAKLRYRKIKSKILENSVCRQRCDLGTTQVRFWSVTATLTCPVIVSFYS